MMCQRHEDHECRPARLLLVRHGESVWNEWGREKKKAGQVPPGMEGVPDHKTPLTGRGMEQARQTAEALFKKFGAPAVIFHSPYERTTQTADDFQATMQKCGAGPIPQYRDLLLVEQQFGRLDAGVAEATGMLEEFHELQKEFDARKLVVGKFYAAPPGGESWFDVTMRTHKMLEKAFRPQWCGKTLLFISHAVTIATFLYHLNGRDEEGMIDFYQADKLDNCGVVHFEYNPGSPLHWDLVDWNKIYWEC